MRHVIVTSLFAILALPHAARADEPAPAAAVTTTPLRHGVDLHVDLQLTFGTTSASALDGQSVAGLRLGILLGRYAVLEGEMATDVEGFGSLDTGSSAWAGLRFHLPTKLSPYVYGRTGYREHTHYPICGFFGGSCTDSVGTEYQASIRDLGAGLEARLGHVRLFAEAGHGDEGTTITSGLGAGF
jgi:hypothetical protein